MKAKLVKLEERQPSLDELRGIAGELLRGKIVAFPTETVYGIAACVNQASAVAKLYQIKKRSESKPLSYHIGNLDALERLHVIQSSVLRYMASCFWPGPVTLLVLNRKDEKIGIRFPKHPIALRLLDLCIEPVVATSANLSGGSAAKTAEEVMKVFGDKVDIVIDGGKTEWGAESTVVDVVQSPPQILRAGVLADKVEAAIERVTNGTFPRKRILIVCTGNSCRSPMAEAWLRAELKRKGLAEQIEVASCGVCAREGGAATMEALLTLRNDEIDFLKFKSRLCRRQDVLYADLILAMGDEHERFIVGLYPPAKDRVVVLNVGDPIGMTIEMYQKSYENIQEKIKRIWPEIVK